MVEKDVAHRRPATLGVQQGDKVQIVKGVAPGERIITQGGASLDDGASVKDSAAQNADRKEGAGE